MGSGNKTSLYLEHTEVAVERSAGEITGLLVQAGARAIHTEYGPLGELAALSFVLPFGRGEVAYKLPVRVEAVERWFKRADRNIDRQRAARIAWRQMLAWLKAQLTIIQLGMVETAEVFLPYAQGADGRSFFDTYRAKMIEGPREQGAA